LQLSFFINFLLAWVLKGKAANINDYFQRGSVSDAVSDSFHRISIAPRLLHMDVLEQVLMNVSDPNHGDYGKHWTKQQIGNLIRNDHAIRAIKQHLKREGAIFLSQTPNGETIEAKATIRTWSRIFSTAFFEFESKADKSKKLVRALEYFVPEELDAHIDSVFGLVELPPPIYGGNPIMEPIPESRRHLRSEGISVDALGYVTPAVFNSVYGISSNTGNGLTTQSALSCIGQSLSTSDLTIFQSNFGIPVQGISSSIGGHVGPNTCQILGVDNCAEANLDFQYLMGLARNIPTIALYEENCDYPTFFQSLVTPPKIISISYASIESKVGASTVSRFNSVAIQLGVMGVTIVVASGDDGVAGFDVRAGRESCAYNPFYPASSPFVLSVGATQVRRP
jgi:tripeptidyl-peptidase-1